jgi:hypothetical protein
VKMSKRRVDTLWLPRQSLSRPSSFPALGDAQSRWNQPGRPRENRNWRPEQPSQFCPRDYPDTPGRDSGLFRPPYSISGASRTDSSGSGHLPEQQNSMGDSGSDAGATIHASFRPLHRAATGSLRTMFKNMRLFSSSRPSTQLSWTVPTGSITSHTPLISPAHRGCA